MPNSHSTKHPADFATRLIDWHQQHGRHDLPWQQTRDPYRVWLSEIMLQQTQVLAVIPYYQRFLTRFATLAALAAAPVEEVMALWSGLGYYARARNLHRCAQIIMQDHGGRFPEDPESIARLPGIGRSTANAIAVFCFSVHAPILDGNVKRILCRAYGVEGFPGTPAVEKPLWQLAASLLPQHNQDCATYIQAQMDLGATVCTRSKPACLRVANACPLTQLCIAYQNNRCTELPAARPRRVVPQRTVRVLLLRDGDKILLERRPPSGIWGGLLSLPELPSNAKPLAYAAQALGCRVDTLDSLPELRHSFTHFQLTLQPLSGIAQLLPHAAESARYCWVATEMLADAALPAPIRKILAKIC